MKHAHHNGSLHPKKVIYRSKYPFWHKKIVERRSGLQPLEKPYFFSKKSHQEKYFAP